MRIYIKIPNFCLTLFHDSGERVIYLDLFFRDLIFQRKTLKYSFKKRLIIRIKLKKITPDVEIGWSPPD
jgi:hypothetical protein